MKRHIRKVKIATTALALLLSVLHPHSHAKSALDIKTAGMGARAISMGRSYVASALGADAIFQNPAALANINSYNLTTMSTKIMDRVDYKMLGGAMPLYGGVVGIGYLGASTPAGYLTTNYNSLNGATPISYGSSLLTLSYGRKLTDLSSAGLSLKFFNNNAEGYDASGSGIDADLGVLFTPKDGVALGASLQNFLPQNLGGAVSWKSGVKEEIPATFKIGGSYQARKDLLVAADLDLISGGLQTIALHGGVEWKPLPMLAFRAGLDQNPSVTDFSLGLGINLKGFNFDYAYKNNSLVENSNAHYFSISFSPAQAVKDSSAPLIEEAQKQEPLKISAVKAKTLKAKVIKKAAKPAKKALKVKKLALRSPKGVGGAGKQNNNSQKRLAMR